MNDPKTAAIQQSLDVPGGPCWQTPFADMTALVRKLIFEAEAEEKLIQALIEVVESRRY